MVGADGQGDFTDSGIRDLCQEKPGAVEGGFPGGGDAAGLATDRMLADLYNIRGFPMVVVVNPLGQKLVDSKYMKGGPKAFLGELGSDSAE